jgi:RNA-directed DNA polymerase
VLRPIKMWLTAPVEERHENGKRRLTAGKGRHCGTPQGGVMTPRTQKITSSLIGD